ncbi:alcohol dehydrogenase catalytic domain-containing protein [Candidatus Poribacteria bacterium]|nr:alcohol dehydrogenase catalytic domain-containing protein [Candidatus Poribacteria bacterium]
MKAIVLNRNHKLKLIDNIPDIQYKPINSDEILIKTLETGICSTDRELREKSSPIIPQKGFDYLILGHEAIGKVEKIGSNITGLKIGDIVVPTVRRRCNVYNCNFCDTIRSDMCPMGSYKERGILGLHGFMSEFFIEKKENLLKVPKNLKEKAVLIEPLSIGVKAIDKSFQIQKGRLYSKEKITEKDIFRQALVIGVGSIGILTSLVLKTLGINLVCIDIDNVEGAKAKIIEKIGGQYINLNQYTKNKIVNIDKLRKNYNMENIDLIIDSSGSSLTSLQLINLLQNNGIYILLSLSSDKNPQPFNFNKILSNIMLKNQMILGCVNSNIKHFEKARKILKWFNKDKNYSSVLDEIITKYNYSEWLKAFDAKSKDRIKVVLTWDNNEKIKKLFIGN